MMTEYTDLSELSDDLVICKARNRHKMDRNPSPQVLTGWRTTAASYVIPWRCERCGRECYEFLNSKGQRIGKPYYKNPVDYPKTHRLDGDTVRAEMIRRSLIVMEMSNGKVVKQTRRRR